MAGRGERTQTCIGLLDQAGVGNPKAATTAAAVQ